MARPEWKQVQVMEGLKHLEAVGSLWFTLVQVP